MEPIRFDNILNFRDVGDLVNRYTGSKKMKTGLLYRSARPDNASEKDRDLLLNTYKINTIIDLRTKSEHIQQAQKRNNNTTNKTSPNTPTTSDAAISHLSAPEPLAPSNNAAATPLKIPGITYSEINFNGGSYSWALIKKLRYTSTAKLLYLMATGYRIQAISILGKEVMSERGLVGLAEDSVEHCTSEVRAVFGVLDPLLSQSSSSTTTTTAAAAAAEQTSWPILVHCTQGKDRTGLVILLILLLLRVDAPAIKADYILSQEELKPEREERLHEIREIGLPDGFADCPEDWIERVAAYVKDKYGGVERYLSETCGVDEEVQRRVREVLLA
ncbi:hypothetical protein AAFC00_003703 [Neodothiora populina]|uniref:Tyrosine specific protein phosphatases domain-containing protein n=1 Tax=Neodothiora populina TaxID=2781224 RepID=A0ABR3PF64_9PEZI